MEILNAVINSTYLGIEDHGILTFWLYTEHSSGIHQYSGGYTLDEPYTSPDGQFGGRKGLASGMDIILKILKVLNVKKWEDLPGKNIRVARDKDRMIAGIGHIIDDKWIYFKQHFEEWDSKKSR